MAEWVGWAALLLLAVGGGGMAWLAVVGNRERRALVAEIKARPRLMIWIDTDGVIHAPSPRPAGTARYLERCAAAVRAQVAEGEGQG